MRLLVVEDDSQLGQALATGLKQRGHVVDWFTNGGEADAALATESFDAVVLDLGLPGGDGMTWLGRWRSGGRRLPVLILTARDEIAQRVAGLDVGADDYLVKPITIDELEARLRAMSRRSAGQAHAIWQHGELTFDTAQKEVSWQGRKVDLTSREIALLEALLANPQRVISKAQLQEKLYDWSGGDPESNTLEVYVHHIRRKIDPQIIRTVRGLGYALGSGEPSA